MRQETTVGIFILASIGALFYLSTHIGFFRFDKAKYSSYAIFFSDISGLSQKSDVKIAGVKVGWVDSIDLLNQSDIQVKAQVMILKDFKLKSDSYAIIRQEGILGNKFLEIVPGSPEAQVISPNGVLKHAKNPIVIDDVMYKVQEIANNVSEVSKSLKEVFAGDQGVNLLKSSVENFSSAAKKINNLSDSLDRILCSNEQNISIIVSEVKTLVKDLKEQLPVTIKNIDQDISKVTTNISEISEKINSGKGLIGKLVNEDDTYKDIQCTVKGVKSYFDKVSKLCVVSDIHSESMTGLAEKFCFKDNKGIFNLRIHPNEDYFYVAGITTSQKGYLIRTESNSEYFDEQNTPILPSVTNQRPQTATVMVATTKTKTEILDDWRFNLQFGKIFSDIAFRIGLFEGFSGLAADYEVPVNIENFRWVSTLEAYDFRGRNHYFNDTRPHLKWLNRMFIGRNIYIVFGADDFVSKWNKNLFFGAGIRFADDDLKYFLPAGVSVIG